MDTGEGEGVNAWTGARKGRVLTTYPARLDAKRAKVQDNCILINGDPLDKRAYHAEFPENWYIPGSTAYHNCIFAIVEIDLFKVGETTLWNHMITGESNASFNSFSTQTSSNTIGTRTNSASYTSIQRPAFITPGVRRYMIEMRYGAMGSTTMNDFTILVNGYPIVQANSPYGCRNIFGVGVVAPQDLAANSTLNRRLLSIFAMKGGFLPHIRLENSELNKARQYLSCVWDIPLEQN